MSAINVCGLLSVTVGLRRRSVGRARASHRDEQQRDAGAGMAGFVARGGGGGAPSRRATHQHEEPLRHVRETHRCTRQERTQYHTRFTFPYGKYF